MPTALLIRDTIGDSLPEDGRTTGMWTPGVPPARRAIRSTRAATLPYVSGPKIGFNLELVERLS
jgi:hypothetical protein